MKEVIEKYQTNTVLRADAYEWLLLQFEEGSLTLDEEDDILKNMLILPQKGKQFYLKKKQISPMLKCFGT
nr:hypothetical protein [uncultured Draconibacterium sp.]